MRTCYLLSCLLWLFMLAGNAQVPASGQNPQGDNSAATHGPITVEGCIGSMNGHFSVVTPGGVYRLKGDHSTMMNNNGKQVRVTGTVISSNKTGRQTLEVSEIKKIHDFCQY
jgi:hypothetical protein